MEARIRPGLRLAGGDVLRYRHSFACEDGSFMAD
jgi:hypothetical protein